MYKYFFTFLFVFTTMQSFALAAWNGRVFKVKDSQELTFNQLTNELSTSRIVVIGENHSTQEVQDLEAKLISEVVKLQGIQNNFALAWEFLNVKDQSKIELNFDLLKEGKLTTQEFIDKVAGGSFYSSYAPVIENVMNLSGKLLGINLTREEKNPVTRGGMSAASPELVPPGYETGSSNYFSRFKAVMGDHVTNEKLLNYFDAQCLTDDVMAFHSLKNLSLSKIFMIAGHFHTDFNDGMVQRLTARAPNVLKANVRIVDASEYKEEELMPMMHDSTFGDVADYVIYVKEPRIVFK